MATRRVLIFCEVEDDDIKDQTDGDIEAALHARLDEVYFYEGPVTFKVVGIDFDED